MIVRENDAVQRHINNKKHGKNVSSVLICSSLGLGLENKCFVGAEEPTLRDVS